MLHVKLNTLINFVMREISKANRKIWKISLNSAKHKDAKELSNLKTDNDNKT